MRACGCTLNNAYMQHSLLALVVIPELRISDIGLVDVRTFKPYAAVFVTVNRQFDACTFFCSICSVCVLHHRHVSFNVC